MLAKLGSYRKDIQWISGLNFVALLMLGLSIGGVARFFAPEVAKPALSGQLKESMLQTGLAQNYDQVRIYLQSRPATEAVEVPGVGKLALTAGEAIRLDAPSFATKISEELAGRVYEGKLDSLTPEQRESVGPLANISKQTYEGLSGAARGLGGWAVFWGCMMVLSGRRFGRLFSLGLTLAAATLIPLLGYDWAESALLSPSGSPPADAGTAAVAAAVKPALEAGAGPVAVYFILGLLFMFLAGFGRLVHWLATSRRSADARTVHQTRSFELELPYDKAFDICMASLGSVGGAVKEHDRSLGKLSAKTGFSWKSYGETIQIDVATIDSDKTRVELSSKPTMPTTIFDYYGKNFENVERISEFLKKEDEQFNSARSPEPASHH